MGMIYRTSEQPKRGFTGPLALLLALGSALACGEEPPPVEFRRGEKIPFGPYDLAVYRVQNNPFGETDVLSVYVRIDPARAEVDSVEQKWVAYLRKLELEDGAGEQYRSLGAMPAEALRLEDRIRSSDASQATRIAQEYVRDVEDLGKSDYLPPDWDEWVLVFQVPRHSRPFSLLLANPDHGDGQPRAASVNVLR